MRGKNCWHRDLVNFLSFWVIFALLPPSPTNNGDVIILHVCNENHNHMTYPSWDMERDRHTFLSFWVIFFALLTLLTWRIKILKNEKNAWGYYHFAREYHKWWSYGIWFLRYGTKKTEFFVILDYFLPFYPLTTRRITILKKKKVWRYYLFTCVYRKWKSYYVWFLRYGAQQKFF